MPKVKSQARLNCVRDVDERIVPMLAFSLYFDQTVFTLTLINGMGSILSKNTEIRFPILSWTHQQLVPQLRVPGNDVPPRAPDLDIIEVKLVKCLIYSF